MKHIKLFESHLKKIEDWDDATVDQQYDFYLDELTGSKRQAEEEKNLTTKQKREVLKNQEDAFASQFNESESSVKQGDVEIEYNKDDGLKETFHEKIYILLNLTGLIGRLCHDNIFR